MALEITLKDWDRSNYAYAHKVAQMIRAFGDPTLSNQADALELALGSMYCTHRDGTQRNVSPERYPDIRYLRHEVDFPGTTTDVHLHDAIIALDALLAELHRQRGIKPC